MVAHLIGHTLPTVVATGAVAHVASKALSARKKAKKPTAKRKWRKANWHPTKATAVKDASYFKKVRHKTKIVKEYDKYFKKWGYTVYVA